MGYCKIILDRLGNLSGGDNVYGTVMCVFGGAEDIRGIECTFVGQVKTKFSKKAGKRTTWYYGNKTLFEMRMTLQGGITMYAGNFEYPFSFTLPSIVPGSYQDRYGNIRYYIKAVVDKPFAFDYKDEVTVNVVAPIDLNLIRQQISLEPVTYQDEKVLCCMCCSSAPLEMRLVMEKNAFIVGERANLRIEINNMTSTNVTELRIELKRYIEYHCDSGNRTHQMKYPITNTRASGVGAHGRRVYIIDFLIPETTEVNNFALCTLIKEWWILTTEAVIPGCHRNLKIPSRIILGHKPIDDTSRPTAPPSSGPTAPPATQDSPSDLPSYYDATHKEDSKLLEPSAPTV